MQIVDHFGNGLIRTRPWKPTYRNHFYPFISYRKWARAKKWNHRL